MQTKTMMKRKNRNVRSNGIVRENKNINKNGQGTANKNVSDNGSVYEHITNTQTGIIEVINVSGIAP